MDKFASLAQQMPQQIPQQIPNTRIRLLPRMPNPYGGPPIDLLPKIQNPFASKPAQKIQTSPSFYPPPGPSAQPAPEVVKVIKAANGAVNANANKVAGLLKNKAVVNAAQNLLNKLKAPSSPIGASPSSPIGASPSSPAPAPKELDKPNSSSRGTMVGGRKSKKSKKSKESKKSKKSKGSRSSRLRH